VIGRIMPDRTVTGVAIVVACVGFAWVVPPAGRHEMIDHHIFLRAIDLMRAGRGYYGAMDQAFRETDGPVETVRAYRMPTIFLAWAALPSNRMIWYVYTTMIAATGLAMLGLVTRPLPAFVAVMYMLCGANELLDDGWSSQYAATELWVVPFVVFAALARRSGRDGLAAALALVATLVREMAAPLILGGLIAAWADGRSVRPWLAATALAVLAYAGHVLCVLPHLGPRGSGSEPPLIGTGRFPTNILGIAGFGLPFSFASGLVLWGMTLAALARRGSADRFAAPYLMLPLAGLIVGRSSWGLMVVPLLILWGGDHAMGLAAQAWRARRDGRESCADGPA
jgi:hypothetical protein